MKIYVGWDSREDIAYQVCEHSIKRRDPSAEVIPLKQNVTRQFPLTRTDQIFSRLPVSE